MFEKIYGIIDGKLLKLIEDFKYIPYRLNKRSEREVGKTYWCGYWHEVYTVLEVKENGHVKVEWENGKITEHCTALDIRHDFELREFPDYAKEFHAYDNSHTCSYSSGEIRAMMYLGIIRDLGNEAMINRMHNEYFNMKNNKHIQNDSVYYFITTRTDINGNTYYKLERDLKKSPHNFSNTKTYGDMLKDTRIGRYSLFDNNNNPLTIKDKVPENALILEIKHIEDRLYYITLDAFRKDGKLHYNLKLEEG